MSKKEGRVLSPALILLYILVQFFSFMFREHVPQVQQDKQPVAGVSGRADQSLYGGSVQVDQRRC